MPEMVAADQSRSKLMFWLRLVVAGIIIGLIVWKNDWDQFRLEFAQTEWHWLSAAVFSFGTALTAGAWRWQFLLRVQQIRFPFPQVGGINMIGFFFNQFLFGSTGGDLVKIFYAIRKAPDRKAEIALSIVMDRVLGLIAILAVTFLLLPLEWQRLSSDEDIRAILIVLAVVLASVFGGLAIALFFPLTSLPAVFSRFWVRVPKREVLESLYYGVRTHGSQGKWTACAIGTAFLTAIPLVSTGWFLAQALHLDIDYIPMTILFSIVLCAMSIPLFPGGHGIREGAFFLLFGVFGVTRYGQSVGNETALACSTLFLFVVLIWSLIGGCIFLLFSGKIKKTDPHV